jgi:hypothetical protein
MEEASIKALKKIEEYAANFSAMQEQLEELKLRQATSS